MYAMLKTCRIYVCQLRKDLEFVGSITSYSLPYSEDSVRLSKDLEAQLVCIQ